MPSVAPAVTHSIILLVLLRCRKQQKANTALDQGQHLPKEAKGTSPVGAHLRANREIQKDKQNPRVQKNLRRKRNE